VHEGTRGEVADEQASGDSGAAGQTAPGLTPRQIDATVEVILGQLFATTGRFFSDRMLRLEQESAALVDELEAHRDRLEEEIAERAIELREIRRRIDAERVRSEQRLNVVEGLRDLQRQFGASSGSRRYAELAAGDTTDQQPDEVIASAQRVADELVSSARRVAEAQHRAEEIERDATERRSAVLAESEALEQQLRDLDVRISRLLSPTTGTPPSADSGADGDEPPTPMPIVRETEVESRAAAAAEERDEEEAETVEVASPRTTTVLFHGVRSFQIALGLERSVKSIDGVLSVRVVDFDDRRLTFAVIHTLGDSLPATLVEQGSVQADVLRNEQDRLELQIRA
jgi:hypothetical protein